MATKERLRIVLVEDEPLDAELVVHELSRAGLAFDWRRVEDALSLADALRAFQPHAVLSDYRLPRFDGMEALRLVLTTHPDVPVVIVTGTVNEETAVECIKAGAADYVTKEHLGRLPHALLKAIERQRLQAEAVRVEAERHASEARAAQQHAVLQAVFDASETGIFAIDREYRYLAFNRAHLLGMRVLYGTEPATGRRLPDCMPNPEDWAHARVNLEHALAGESVIDEAATGLPSLARRFYSISHSPIRRATGEVDGVLVMTHDVTSRRQQEEELRLLHRAIEQSPAAIMITDPSGAIEFVNPRFEEVTGYTSEEVRGRNPRLLKSGRTPIETYQALWNTLLHGSEWRGEILNRRKDGSLFWQRSSICAVRDAGDQIRNFVAVQEDITREKAAAETLRAAETQLLHMQRIEAVGHLAGGIAHDFNNILSVILGHAERLTGELTQRDDLRHRAEQISWSAERAADLTRQLLAFSRRQVLTPQVVRIDEVFRDARGMLERLAGEDVELEVQDCDTLGLVRADPAQMIQVLLNLVVNARDAMPDGGRIDIGFADVDLDAGYSALHEPMPAGRYVMLSVSDGGVGMPPEVQQRIFEPFFTTKPEGRGTGLGLSTVYGIVKQSGGFVWVYSEIGLGTTFKIYLPRVDPEEGGDGSAATSPADRPARPAPRGARILVVEDDDGVRELVTDALEEEGYRVDAASRPSEALERLSPADPIDLLLTDVVMPGMNGRQLAGRLTQERPGLRVMYLSGYAGDVLLHRGSIAPGERFLQKPFSRRALLEAVARALEGAE